MPDVTEIQLMKISAFTVGSSVYKGIRTARITENPLNTYAVMEEGDLRPSRLEQIETDGPAVRFTLQLSSAAAKALSGTTAATCTMVGRDVMAASGTKTVTITLPTFDAVDLSLQNKAVDGVTITGSATAYAVA